VIRIDPPLEGRHKVAFALMIAAWDAFLARAAEVLE